MLIIKCDRFKSEIGPQFSNAKYFCISISPPYPVYSMTNNGVYQNPVPPPVFKEVCATCSEEYDKFINGESTYEVEL
jgi:hypothetical protein